ncbi:hypothetical protein DSECCO2_356610 [anaerobic digester metagenome]
MLQVVEEHLGRLAVEHRQEIADLASFIIESGTGLVGDSDHGCHSEIQAQQGIQGDDGSQ